MNAFIKENKFFLPIGFLSLFLLLYNLATTLFFIGDVGWFYLSARDMLLTGKIPLVGIPSSHPWLHQGPMWTYLLGISLWLFHFNPIGGAFFPILFGIGSIVLLYHLGKTLFSERVGLVASLLYATSPLVIFHVRMPYHTAPIPFFSLLLFFATSQWIKGKIYYFPLALFSLSMLYNFELATIIYGILLLVIFLFGVYQKKNWGKELLQRKCMGISLVAFISPLIPILLYDITHGFPQTFRYALWIGYKILRIFSFPAIHRNSPSDSFFSVLSFSYHHLQTLLFLPNALISLLLFLTCFLFLGRVLYLEYRQKKFKSAYLLLGCFLFTGVFGFLAVKTISEAYLPMLFPFIILAVSLVFSAGMEIKKIALASILLLALIAGLNVYSLIQQNYLLGKKDGYGPTFTDRLFVAKTIVREARGAPYTIIGRGKGSQFRSYTMNYEYLTWWLGQAPANSRQRQRFIVRDTPEKVYLQKIDYD